MLLLCHLGDIYAFWTIFSPGIGSMQTLTGELWIVDLKHSETYQPFIHDWWPFEEADCSLAIFHYCSAHVEPHSLCYPPYFVTSCRRIQRTLFLSLTETLLSWACGHVKRPACSHRDRIRSATQSTFCVDWEQTRKEMMGMIKGAQRRCWFPHTRTQRSVTRLQTWASASPHLLWTGMSPASSPLRFTSWDLAEKCGTPSSADWHVLVRFDHWKYQLNMLFTGKQ